MKKWTVAVLLWSLCIMPSLALAGCADTFIGESEKLSIAITDCEKRWHEENEIEGLRIVVFEFTDLVQGGEYQYSISFEPECQLSKKGFSCSSESKTALAGSTYAYTEDTNPSCEGQRPGIRLTCAEGCRPELPRYFYIHPHEC